MSHLSGPWRVHKFRLEVCWEISAASGSRVAWAGFELELLVVPLLSVEGWQCGFHTDLRMKPQASTCAKSHSQPRGQHFVIRVLFIVQHIFQFVLAVSLRYTVALGVCVSGRSGL